MKSTSTSSIIILWDNNQLIFTAEPKKQTFASLIRTQSPISVKLGMWIVVSTSSTHMV